MTIDALSRSPEFSALKAAAVRLGTNPLQIQGPGGNVSLKADGQMLVKASGTWLADAQKDTIFAPVDAAAMKTALLQKSPAADTPGAFLLGGDLRPSIETSFHAALDEPVVLHTHCVATLACSTGPVSAAALDRHRLVLVPYCKPGAELAAAILDAWRPGTKGAVLQNHGLIVTGETVADAEARLNEVSRQFDPGPVPEAAPARELAQALEGTGWSALGAGATTALAFHPAVLKAALGAALFPDQVIFLGPEPFSSGLPVTPPPGPPAKLAFLEGLGAALPEDATPACWVVAEMMGEVVFRLPEAPTRLTHEDVSQLLGWDAEKYRQALENQRTARLAQKTP